MTYYTVEDKRAELGRLQRTYTDLFKRTKAPAFKELASEVGAFKSKPFTMDELKSFSRTLSVPGRIHPRARDSRSEQNARLKALLDRAHTQIEELRTIGTYE